MKAIVCADINWGIGKGTGMRLGANLLIQAIGRGRHVRYFDDYNKAIKWLRRE